MISKLKALLKLKIRLTKCCYLNICQQGIICGNGYLSVQTIRPIAPRAQPAPPAQPAPSASALNSVAWIMEPHAPWPTHHHQHQTVLHLLWLLAYKIRTALGCLIQPIL